MRNALLAAMAVSLGLSGAAFAQSTSAKASTDLNVRSGPGIQYPIVGVLGRGADVSVLGCIDGLNWCEVATPNGSGWSYSDYLMVGLGDQVVPLYPNMAQVGVTVVPSPVEVVAPYQTVGRLGAPVVDVSGTTMVAVDPLPEVTTYVTSNVVDPYYLDGEVVLGAVVPETVTLAPIPTYPEYAYGSLNGQTVLVDPVARNIVYVYR